MRHIGYLIAVLAAAVAPWAHPLLATDAEASEPAHAFPGWPEVIDGRAITRVPLTDDERPFAEAFPGEVARFRDGEGQHILRWIREPTRRLHPASHCLRASGYTLSPERLCPGNGGPTTCYQATRDGVTLEITEQLYDEAGQRWAHVSAWYWAASLGTSVGPWWARTTIRPAKGPSDALPRDLAVRQGGGT